MASKRIGRITEDIRRELADIFRSLKDPRISPLTSIVRVEVTGDLSYAKVYISTMGDDATDRETVKGLASAGGFIRRELGNRLKLRKTPELKFIANGSIAHGAHIAQILDSLAIPEESEEEEA